MVSKPKSGKSESSSQVNDSSATEEAEDFFGEGEGEGRSKGVSEAIKKVISAGIGAAFMTEESIRNYLAEVRLPKDVMNLLLQSAAKSKEELLDRVGNEVVRIVSKIDFVQEASRFVEEHKFKISAEVEVIKKDKR